MIQHAPDPDVGAWRPQQFGRENVRRIVDPIVEPLWIGERTIVRVTGGSVDFLDASGRPAAGYSAELADVADGLRRGVRASDAVLDGYLTRQPAAGPALVRMPEAVAVPTAAELATQLLVGIRNDHRRRLLEDDRAIAAVERADAPLAFVAVDLLEIDGTSLLDVPLLERKRLLASAIEEGDLLRVGAFVRPPVDSWLGTWRSIGFLEVAYKAANGRYRPGAMSDDWATARIPKR